MIIGLTGQSGAGKSEAAKIFKDKGFLVIDADKTAKEVYDTERECIKKMQDEFGKDIALYGEIDRKKLASIVFSSKEALNRLNKIVLPYIVKQVHIQIKNAKMPYILLDAPLLFESGLGDICSYTIGILAPYSQREKRILKRDSLNIDEAKKRLLSQPDDTYYIERCDFIILNDGAKDKLKNQIYKFLSSISYKEGKCW